MTRSFPWSISQRMAGGRTDVQRLRNANAPPSMLWVACGGEGTQEGLLGSFLGFIFGDMCKAGSISHIGGIGGIARCERRDGGVIEVRVSGWCWSVSRMGGASFMRLGWGVGTHSGNNDHNVRNRMTRSFPWSSRGQIGCTAQRQRTAFDAVGSGCLPWRRDTRQDGRGALLSLGFDSSGEPHSPQLALVLAVGKLDTQCNANAPL